ncbi:MAG: efflux RND transporter permease subunit, partial [Bacteroidota bacterium]
MRLPKLALSNYQFVLIVVGLAVFVGVTSLLNMPRSEDPNPKFPSYIITAIYPGTSPEDMEELVVDPIEEAADRLDDVDKINSKIEEGVAVIVVETEFGVDPDEKYDELLVEMNAIKDELPDDLYDLDVQQADPIDQVYIQQIALVGEGVPYPELVDLAENLEDDLKPINGIKNISILAHPEEEIRVSLDFQRMANRGIAVGQVVQVLQGNNLNIPGGDIASGGRSFNIKTSG